MFPDITMEFILYICMWFECIIMALLVYENYRFEKQLERYKSLYRKICLMSQNNICAENNDNGEKKRQ